MSGLGSPETLSGRSRVCSERHDVLYSGARKVLNKRHIRRPWFNMNPFMENTDLMVDLENFLPNENKDIQPRESLVLCEHYNVDLPIDTREIALDGFFKYLNSDAWRAGCSVRVMEGQLLDQLLLGLYRLESEKTAVRHTTHAVARNQRQRTGCHKQSKEDFVTTDDTILLEFAYFGRLTKGVPNTKTLDPFEYLHKSEILEDEPEPETDETNNEQLIDTKKRGKATMKTSANRLHAQVVAPRGAGSDTRSGFDRGLSSVGAQRVGHPEKHWECVGNKRIVTVDVNAKSLHEWRKPISPTFPDFEEEDDDYDLDLKFSNGTGFQKEKEEWEKEERDNFFGEEFYLSDHCKKKPVKFIGTKKLLQKKKAELQKRREKRKAQVTEKRENNKPLKLPPMPPLEVVVTPSPSNLRHATIKLPDHVPTMEEFINILKNDDYIDPRFRNNMRLKRRIIAQRYNMEKGTNRNLTLSSMANIRGDIETLASPGRGLLGSSNTVEKRGSVSNVRPLQMLDKNDRSIELPAITLKAHTELKTTRSRASMEVLGVTDSLPCKDHFYSEATTFQTSRERYEKPKPETHKRRCSIPNLPKISSSSRTNVKGRRATHDEDKSATTFRKSVQVVPSSKIISNDNPTTTFPKIISESEIDDSVSSDESVSEFDESSTEFDTQKLNFKYSIERLRKKSSKEPYKKKPAFISILAKYYKMQNALDKFKSSVGKESKTTRFRASNLGKTAAERKAAGKKVVGKLKLFAFLDTDTDKPRQKLNLDNVARGDFCRYDLDGFCQELQLALDKFVVRREVVMSVLQAFNTTITSVTFTLPACFQQQDNPNSHEH